MSDKYKEVLTANPISRPSFERIIKWAFSLVETNDKIIAATVDRCAIKKESLKETAFHFNICKYVLF